MFWKKGQAPPSSSRDPSSAGSPAGVANAPVEVVEATATPPRSDFSVEALETLTEVLRSLGRHSFDLDEVSRDETAEAFEKWAMRLLVGEIPSSEDGTSGARLARGIRRDWSGVRRFVERHRKGERDYVVSGMDNLRQAVRVFIQCTTSNFRAEQSSEATVTAELDELGQALAVNDHQKIREAAERTAATVYHELEARRSRETRQIEALQGSMDKLRHEITHLRKEVRTDGLTRIFNRAALDEHITQVADHAFLGGTEACVVMLDIDHFKGVNDNYGHQSGDEVLRQVADTIVRGFFRREDFVARYGGEEFCVVCQHTTFETTRERAERLRQAVENLSITAFGRTLKVSVSFGIALLQRGETAERWLQRADEALYRAKQKGRNCISIAPLGLGEALGGTGAPLGATLHVRSGDINPRILVSEDRAESSRPPSTASPRTVSGKAQRADGRAAEKAVERPSERNYVAPRSSTIENSPGRNSKLQPRAGNPSNKVPNSPIAALLGPGSRR